MHETEVDERTAEPRPHPQGADVAVFVDLENEEPARHLRVVAGGLDDAHKHIGAAIAVDVARLETVDGIRQGPTFAATVVAAHLHVVKRVRDGDEAERVFRVAAVGQTKQGEKQDEERHR